MPGEDTQKLHMLNKDFNSAQLQQGFTERAGVMPKEKAGR
jgi:hypothetical protein